MNWQFAPLRVIALFIAVGVNVWLLRTMASEIVFEDAVTTKDVDWNPRFSGTLGDASGRKPIDAYQEILARPVFFKSRTPFIPAPSPLPPSVVASPPPVVVDPGLVLGGVMIKSGVKKAYVLSRANAGGAWANEGEEFMGWRIRSINGAGAKLEQSGRSIELKLYPKE
jgi:hypothetical protein